MYSMVWYTTYCCWCSTLLYSQCVLDIHRLEYCFSHWAFQTGRRWDEGWPKVKALIWISFRGISNGKKLFFSRFNFKLHILLNWPSLIWGNICNQYLPFRKCMMPIVSDDVIRNQIVMVTCCRCDFGFLFALRGCEVVSVERQPELGILWSVSPIICPRWFSSLPLAYWMEHIRWSLNRNNGSEAFTWIADVMKLLNTINT